jgi:hypothetical protein
MRVGYLFMGVGLVLVKWPLFFQNGGLASLPVFEGVVAALLTAMSLLAFLGLRYPIQLLPVLVFESLWKLIWLAAVGVPHLVAGDMDQDPQLKSVSSTFRWSRLFLPSHLGITSGRGTSGRPAHGGAKLFVGPACQIKPLYVARVLETRNSHFEVSKPLTSSHSAKDNSPTKLGIRNAMFAKSGATSSRKLLTR